MPKGMNEEAKGFMGILIREVQDIIRENRPKQAVSKIQELLGSWVSANDLHPERVETFKTTGKWRTMCEASVKLGPFVGVARQTVRRTRDGGLEIATLEAYQFKGRNIPAGLGRLLSYLITTLGVGQVRESLGG